MPQPHAPGRLPQKHIGPIADEEHQENVDEGLPAGEAVGVVEPVPDKVQHIDGKAGEKQQQQAAVHRLLPDRYLPAGQVEEEEEERTATPQ